MSRFLIACGGTGGHLAPGIALAEELQSRGHEVRLLVSRKPIDTLLLRKYPHLPADRIPAAPFTLRPAGLVRFVAQQLAGLACGVRLVRDWRPDLVLGFGGFTTASVVLAAVLFRVPVALHEANRVPGRAIRWLGPLAERVYLPPGVRLRGVRSSRQRACGLPVRKEFTRVPRSAAMASFGFEPARRLLLVLGGSQGASPLTAWAEENLEALAQEGVQVVALTGPGKDRGPAVREWRARDGSVVKSYFLPLCDRMPELLSCADLAVTRAGAGTIAELARCGVPAILVPYPHAADNHQTANARHVEQLGGGLVVEQPYLGGLRQEVLEVIFNDWLRQRLRENLARLDADGALRLLAGDLEQVAARPSAPGTFATVLAA